MARVKVLPLLILAVGGVVLFGGWAVAAEPWEVPAEEASKQNPVPADEKSIARGKELYVQGCVACHGVTGKGNGPASVALDPKPADHTSPKMLEETDGSLFWKISTGRGAMPTFEDTYPAEDRWHLVNYVRTLAPKKSGTNTPTKGGKS